MKIDLDPISGKLVLQFGYRRELVEAIKSLPDRRYNPENKSWSVGFDESSLGELLAILAGNNWPQDVLNKAEADCKEYLGQHPVQQLSEREFLVKIKPPLILMGELVVSAYLDGKITQLQQSEMLNIINHLSLKDFIHK